MQTSLSLNDLYEDYIDGTLKKENLEAAIFTTIRNNLNRFGLPGWNKDDCDDFISWIYPRIGRAIIGYKKTGSSFEAYIGSMVRLTAKEFRSRQIRNHSEETAAWITQIPDIYVCEEEADYDEQLPPKTKYPEKLKNPRQVLILLLKCCIHVSSDFVEKVSPSLGIEPESLCAMIDYLKGQRVEHKIKLAALRERINRQFYRCIFLERSLKTFTEDNITAQRLRVQLERGRNRLNNMRKQLARLRIDPTNLQIAKILGISKGTVDTVLFTLKAQWNNTQKKTTLL